MSSMSGSSAKGSMRFSAFIESELDEIVAEWGTFAKTMLPSAKTMSELALRNHGRDILLAIAKDMETSQSEDQRSAKSKGAEPVLGAPETAAATHGVLRQLAGFDLLQLVGEFRAMRASVLALWRRRQGDDQGAKAIEEIARFNEGIDQALAESVERYSAGVEASRDMFLAVLGHDLRGPLSGINMSNKMLAMPGLSEEARQKAGLRIGRASQAMNHLITDLLEFTRTRLGSGIPIERSACDVGKVCEEALDAVRASHPEREFVQQFSGRLDARADSPRLNQALSNLLSNAVQHGDRNSPIFLSANGDDRCVVLKISNSGKPIAASALQIIFEPLVQAPNETEEPHERSKTSLGLGLFIVREIVLGHGGEVTVQSSAETGTVFTITLPRGTERAGPPATAGGNQAPRPFAGPVTTSAHRRA
jgi:signal transduction histidine kinase